MRDSRIALAKLIEQLNAPDLLQALAFTAGYEDGKMCRTLDLNSNVQIQDQALTVFVNEKLTKKP